MRAVVQVAVLLERIQDGPEVHHLAADADSEQEWSLDHAGDRSAAGYEPRVHQPDRVGRGNVEGQPDAGIR